MTRSSLEKPLSAPLITQDNIGKAWTRMVDCIAHDLTTPLATLRMGAELLEETLPKLIKGYRLAVEQNLLQAEIPAKRLKFLEAEYASDLKAQIDEMFDFLKLLKLYSDQLPSDTQTITWLSARACIDELLQTYPFDSEEKRALVQFDCRHDFKFKCAPIFIKSLLTNLLTNALRCIDVAGKGKISLWTEQEDTYNVLHFKDTSLGMDENRLAQVFKRFFSKSNQDIAPDLGFCRLALLHTGGDITCHSSKNEYTEFVIKFAKDEPETQAC